jgi:hypothetical protein
MIEIQEKLDKALNDNKMLNKSINKLLKSRGLFYLEKVVNKKDILYFKTILDTKGILPFINTIFSRALFSNYHSMTREDFPFFRKEFYYTDNITHSKKLFCEFKDTEQGFKFFVHLDDKTYIIEGNKKVLQIDLESVVCGRFEPIYEVQVVKHTKITNITVSCNFIKEGD